MKLGFVGFVLGFVGFMGCSLVFREVRWICPGFVDFMGCSLDYKLSGVLRSHPPLYRPKQSLLALWLAGVFSLWYFIGGFH